MKNRCAFIIFAHNDVQSCEDIIDMINNINFFHNNCDFFINHKNIIHEKIKTRYNVTYNNLNKQPFIFGAFTEMINTLSIEEINSFDHFCLVSANQYFIGDINFEKDINYLQFLNTENWDETYIGKDTNRKVIGFPLQQPYGRWDMKDLYKKYDINNPMSANWECGTLTKEAMLLAKTNINTCIELYPNEDMINVFPAYMALLSAQEWRYPPHFGTYDPSNPDPKNKIITISQIESKRNSNYFSIKRVNYNKCCPMKEFVRKNYMI